MSAGAGHCGVCVDDVVVIIPDDESRQMDEQVGYTLPLSFGNVLAVHPTGVKDHPEPCVQVAWLRAATLQSKFSVWYKRPGEPNVDYIKIEALQVEESTGEIMKIEFSNRNTIKPASRKLFAHLLEDDASIE